MLGEMASSFDKSADELAKVKGIGKKLVDQNKTNLKFEAPKAGG